MPERVTASELARVLGESCHVLLARALKVLGEARCVAILIDTLSIESNGGLLVQDCSRRRSPGGTFLHLVRERATPEERQAIFRRAGRRA